MSFGIFARLSPCFLVLMLTACANFSMPAMPSLPTWADISKNLDFGQDKPAEAAPVAPPAPQPAPDAKLALAAPIPALSEIKADPQRFQGMAGKSVVDMVGQPNYRRDEPPAQVWQFYGDGCVLDLFLYEETGSLQVTHVELRSLVPGQSAAPDCLAPLYNPRRGS